MTDRELLEMAAKAAGIVGEWSDTYGSITVDDVSVLGFHLWNPITDDGDALRLAVKLNIVVICYPADRIVSANNEEIAYDYSKFGGDCDPYAATRRAIVRAAAEIGRAMPSP